MHIADGSTQLYSGGKYQSDKPIYSAGWLGGPQDAFTSGSPSPELETFLLALDKAPLIYMCRGTHTCELCGKERGNGQHWVETPSAIWALPAMFAHYVRDHGYLPPPGVYQAPYTFLTGEQARGLSRPLTAEELQEAEKEYQERMAKIEDAYVKKIEAAEDLRVFGAMSAVAGDVPLSSQQDFVASILKGLEPPHSN